MFFILTKTEKVTLGMILREKIVETHDLEKIFNEELKNATTESSKIIYKSAIKNVRDIRDECYAIAIKLKIK